MFKKIKIKLTELYLQEREEILKILLKKYLNFIKLFIKKKYKLLIYKIEFKAKIKLRKRFILLLIKQQHKSKNKLKLKDKFINKFLKAGYI